MGSNRQQKRELKTHPCTRRLHSQAHDTNSPNQSRRKSLSDAVRIDSSISSRLSQLSKLMSSSPYCMITISLLRMEWKEKNWSWPLLEVKRLITTLNSDFNRRTFDDKVRSLKVHQFRSSTGRKTIKMFCTVLLLSFSKLVLTMCVKLPLMFFHVFRRASYTSHELIAPLLPDPPST